MRCEGAGSSDYHGGGGDDGHAAETRSAKSAISDSAAGYADGIPLAEIAATLGVDQGTVQKYAHRNGLLRRSPRLGPNQTKEAADLYVAGSSLASVATHFGVATDTVATAQLTVAAIKLRRLRGWKYE